MTTDARSPRITRIHPHHAVPGAQVVIEGGPFPVPGAWPAVRVGNAEARVSFSSPAKVRFVVPLGTEPGAVAVRLGGAPGETVFLEVAETVATGVHCVDNPAVAPDGTIYATCSGSRGQQTPVSVYRIPPGGVREILATGVTNATSLAFDPLGRLHVTSRFDGTVSRIDGTSR